MRVQAEIKAGHHSPPLGWRLRHLRFWFFRTPAGFCIKNLKAEAYFQGHWVDLLTDGFSAYIMRDGLPAPAIAQINKVGGVAWWLPKWSATLKRVVHANSRRVGFSLVPRLYRYAYTRGYWYPAPIPALELWQQGMPFGFERPGYWPCRLFAYRLGVYVGGKLPLPFDMRVSYDVEYFY